MRENEKARLWRKAMGFSREQLARLTGYSASAIVDIEAGKYRNTGHPVPEPVMRRYRLICGAITAGLSFDWFRAKVTSDEAVRELVFPVAKQQQGRDAP